MQRLTWASNIAADTAGNIIKQPTPSLSTSRRLTSSSLSDNVKLNKSFISQGLEEVDLEALIRNVFDGWECVQCSVERLPRPNNISNLMWKLTWLESVMFVNFVSRILRPPTRCQNIFPIITNKNFRKNKSFRNYCSMIWLD